MYNNELLKISASKDTHNSYTRRVNMSNEFNITKHISIADRLKMKDTSSWFLSTVHVSSFR